MVDEGKWRPPKKEEEEKKSTDPLACSNQTDKPRSTETL